MNPEATEAWDLYWNKTLLEFGRLFFSDVPLYSGISAPKKANAISRLNAAAKMAVPL